jgi:hypothetical protein
LTGIKNRITWCWISFFRNWSTYTDRMTLKSCGLGNGKSCVVNYPRAQQIEHKMDICDVRFDYAKQRAFYEMVESEGDSHESQFVIQASHWTGGEHEWGSHTRKTCDEVSFKRLRAATPTKRLPTSVA